MRRIWLGLLAVVLMGSSLGAGMALQHARDQAQVDGLLRDYRKVSAERGTAHREAQESAVAAMQASAQAARASSDLTEAQAKASSDAAAKVKAADDAGFMRGFCEVASVVGTDKATLGQVVHSIDDKLWSACMDGIAAALKVGVGAAPVPAPVWQPSVPSAPLSVYGGILCIDGSISHAAQRQGACSWHGGIAG